MATDSFTETTRTGFGSRIMNSLKGVIIGIVLFAGSLALLWWNEGNLARDQAALREVKDKVVAADVQQASSASDGKLLYLSGPIQSSQQLGDDQFLRPGDYLILQRIVEMYQWKEIKEERSEKKVGGSEETVTTYKYETGWHSGRIESGKFYRPSGHENPELPVSEQTWRSQSSNFGSYDGASVLEQISADRDLNLSADMLIGPVGKLESGKIAVRKNPGIAEPQVGDIRVSYKVLLPGIFSVIAQQQNSNTLVSYTAANGKEKFLVASGVKSPEQLIAIAESESKTLAWILRLVGFFLMWLGLSLIVAPLPTLFDVLPFLGSIGRGVLGLITGVVAFVLSVSIILVSMIAHNIIALLLTVAVVLVAFVCWIKKKKSPALAGAAISAKSSP